MNIEQNSFNQKVDEMDTLINLHITEFKNIYEVLGLILINAKKSNDESLINSIIRMQIKSSVSIFESACYSLRYIARDICSIKKISIPPKYSDLFNEKKKFELKDKIKLSMQFLGYSTSGIENIDVQSKEWQSVCDLLETRHRITHPKSISDLSVSEKDLEKANISLIWFTKQLYRIMKKDIPDISLKISDDDLEKFIYQFKEKHK